MSCLRLPVWTLLVILSGCETDKETIFTFNEPNSSTETPSKSYFGKASEQVLDRISTTEFHKQTFIDKALRSTTGPFPPLAVQNRDFHPTGTTTTEYADEMIIPNVPIYHWRHGCAPTTLGMVLGYYDHLGYDMFDGDASVQTDAVNQAIASGGTLPTPAPDGAEQHLEDYGLPKDDTTPSLLDDAYITKERLPHEDNCIADYMQTSRSERGNRYGWTIGADIGPSFIRYVDTRDSGLLAESTTYWHIEWERFKNEINEGRPLLLLVDADGNTQTDHFVTAIGYREGTDGPEYACLDAWSEKIRFQTFAYMKQDQPWGIALGYTFKLTQTDAECLADWQCDDGNFCNGLEHCDGGICMEGSDFGPACNDATPLERYENSLNFDTTDEKWFVLSDIPNGWWAANIHGRTIWVNGINVDMGEMPLPASYNDKYYFRFSEGQYPFTAFGYW